MRNIILIMLASLTLFGADAFISAQELKSKLGSNVVIIDTTDEATYKLGHIPGALRVEISKFRHPVDTYQLINSPDEIQKVARDLGINNDSYVVLYGHNKGKELLKASYVALALSAHGFTNVSILNGGYPSWLSEYEFDELISTKNEKARYGNFTAKFNKNILVDLDYVKSRISKVPMIEARPIKYFNGSEKSNGVKRLGHIAKAKSSYWREKFDREYNLKKDASLNDIFLKRNGLNPAKEVIAYCTGGLEASMNWYILNNHLKFKDVKIYDGSMRQWGNREDTPMEK